MYKILGYSKNSGFFNKGKENERAWENYTLHCSYCPSHDVKGLVGELIKDIKVSAKIFSCFYDYVGGDVVGQIVNFEFELRNFNGVDKIITTDIIPVD